MKRIISKILFFYIVFVLYFNIGWAIDAYYQNYVFHKSPQTVLQTIASGPFRTIVEDNKNNHLTFNKAEFMVIWPILIIGVLVQWLIVGVYYFIYYLFWFVFAGGAAKLLGIG